MAQRWTPQHFIKLRRIRVVICAVLVTVASVATFAVTARKSVALTVNGETRTVTTYALSAQRLLQEQGISVKTHDLVTTSTDGDLTDHSVVTVRSAYQTTITIDGQEVPFWTVATSADQLLGFFKENERSAATVTVNINNVYNQLTGGLVINKSGPVTVIADGKTSVAPDGKLPAASILDARGIVLNKEDRVSVEQSGDTVVLRVRRVTHGQSTQVASIPFGTHTVVDSTLSPGQTVVQQTGKNGEKQQVYNVTYVDGVAESKTLVSETTTQAALDQVVAVGPDDSAEKNGGTASNSSSPSPSSTPSTPSTSSSPSTSEPSSKPTTDQPSTPAAEPSTPKTEPTTPKPSPQPSEETPQQPVDPTPTGLWRPTPAQAQAYAAGAAAQQGWTGQQWTDLVTLWNRESGWRWYAANPNSSAYGIPQALPGSRMADFGANWKDDASIQIAWGLNYIKGRYGNPSAALQYFYTHNWY